MSHEGRIREKLATTNRTKLNRYSEMHFDAPVRDFKRRTVLNAYARRGDAAFADALERLFPETEEPA